MPSRSSCRATHGARGIARDRPVFSYLLEFSYHGGAYGGWQRQPDVESIQGHLEGAFRTLVGEHVHVHGAGRTDAGVHALRQCAHVRIPREFAPTELRSALNGNIPADICVGRVVRVPESFHARYSAIGKRYVYRTVVSRRRPVHGRDLFHWVKRSVDLGRVRAGAAQLVGQHDFAAFSTKPGYDRPRGTVRHLQRLRTVARPHGFDLIAQGDGFLYNMVRTIAGTLIECGTGRREPEEIASILASRDRRKAGTNAPAKGLYLMRVLYPPEAFC